VTGSIRERERGGEGGRGELGFVGAEEEGGLGSGKGRGGSS